MSIILKKSRCLWERQPKKSVPKDFIEYLRQKYGYDPNRPAVDPMAGAKLAERIVNRYRKIDEKVEDAEDTEEIDVTDSDVEGEEDELKICEVEEDSEEESDSEVAEDNGWAIVDADEPVTKPLPVTIFSEPSIKFEPLFNPLLTTYLKFQIHLAPSELSPKLAKRLSLSKRDITNPKPERDIFKKGRLKVKSS